MRILIFGDIHGRTFWKDGVKSHPDVDMYIFLGDYLDRYPDEKGITNESQIANFREIIDFKKENPDRVTLLLGNHDLHYISELFKLFASGGRMDRSHRFEIAEIFKENKDCFQLCKFVEDGDRRIIFSHAGILPGWYKEAKEVIGELTEDNLNNLLNTNKGLRVLCYFSYYRGGVFDSGSMVWADVREHYTCKEPIDGFYQVFGHTIIKRPWVTKNWACLDCRMPMLMVDGKVDWKEED